MPSRCCKCGETKAKLITVVSSKYRETLRVFMTRKAAAPRARVRVCLRCYNAIRAAHLAQTATVVLPSDQGRRAGRGLFAMRDLDAGEHATAYTGLLVDKKDVAAMPTTSHMRTFNSTHVVDGRAGRHKCARPRLYAPSPAYASRYGGGDGAMANRPPPGARANAKITNYEDRRTAEKRVHVRVLARKEGGQPLRAGTELTVSYGRGYQMAPLPALKANSGRLPRPLPPSELSPGYRALLQKDRVHNPLRR
jgi:hypothetical protein